MTPRPLLPRSLAVLGLLLVLCAPLWPADAAPAAQPQTPPMPATAAPAPLAADPSPSLALPSSTAVLAFEPNVGQLPSPAHFQVQALGGTVAFAPSSLIFTLPAQASAPTASGTIIPRPGRAAGRSPFERRIAAQPVQPELPPAVFQQLFLDTTPTALTGQDQLPGTVGYFQGDDPANWFSDIPTYGSIQYDTLYPGITLSYSGRDSRLKSLFTVAPGADPARIRWRYNDASAVRIDPSSGELLVTVPPTAAGGIATTLREAAPIAWQEVDGQQQPVPVSFALRTDGSVGFALGSYDAAYQLVIDPTLSYSLFEAAGPYSQTNDVAVDASGNVYTVSTLDTSLFGDSRIIVKKTSPSGAELARGYLIGSDFDAGLSIAVDVQGRVYVGGWTSSPDFPRPPESDPNQESRLNTPINDDTRDRCITDSTDSFCSDAFVVRLTPALALDGADSYSATFGGRQSDAVYALAVDGAGNVYATGQTDSLDFPTQVAAQSSCDLTNQFCNDGFVLRINAAGTLIDYSSYLGDAWADSGSGIAVTASGEAYVTGTFDIDSQDASAASTTFLAKFAATGSQQYRLLLGGTGEDGASGIALADPADDLSAVYLTGWTANGAIVASNAPMGLDAYHGGDYDAFLMQLSAQGTVLSTSLIGGTDWDEGTDVALNANGNVFVAGSTTSGTSFPAVPGPDTTAGAAANVFLTMLTADQSGLGLSMQIGGTGGLFGNGSYASALAVDHTGNAYLVGETYSADYPGGPANTDPGVLSRGFLSQVDGLPPAPPKYTISYYIQDRDPQAAFELGCEARFNGERGVVLLSFGTPATVTDDQNREVAGVLMKNGIRIGYLTLDEIKDIAINFATGYSDWATCPDAPTIPEYTPPPQQLALALGITNAKRCPDGPCQDAQGNLIPANFEDNEDLTRDHGKLWATMVNVLNGQASLAFPKVRFLGAADIEYDLRTFGSTGTFEWLKGYNSLAQWPYLNYGSCDGCPNTQPFADWDNDPPQWARGNVGGRDTTQLLATDYPTDALLQAGDLTTTIEKVFLASAWFKWALPLPQIYYKVQVPQWYNVKRYAAAQGYSMVILGPLTGCASDVNCASEIETTDDWREPEYGVPPESNSGLPRRAFAPYQGWQALYDTLSDDQAPDGSTPEPPNPRPAIPWLTDLRYQARPATSE